MSTQASGPLQSFSRVSLAIVIGLYSALTFLLIRISMLGTHGIWVYPMDDEYIAMAMAKNFVRHGVWGVTPYGFTSSTSTPFFTLLTAGAFRVFGIVDWVPLAVAFAAGIAALVAADRVLRPCSTALRIGALAAICFLTPLPALALLGMEHTLQIALVLLFISTTVPLVDRPSDRLGWTAAVVVIIMVGTRYESLFLVGASALWFGAHRKFRLAVELVLAGAFPVLAYGLASVLNGWYWLPASVVLKGTPLTFSLGTAVFILVRFINNIRNSFDLAYVIAVLILAGAFRFRHLPSSVRYVLLVTIVTWAVHMGLAQTGSVYRYEAYLIALSLAALALVANEFREAPVLHQGVLAAVAFLAMWPLLMRFEASTYNLPRASHSTWQQQYQMSEFLRQHYSGAGVAVNDIGVINYRSEIHCLDMAGLATQAVFQGLRDRAELVPVWTREAEARNVRVAIVYDSWFPVLPPTWVRAGSWKVADKSNLGGDTVSFYAVGGEDVAKLKGALIDFAPSLPPGERVYIY